ncbi:LysM peptidoglycan-binding domain-containing protein [Ancylomarina longa]|nr:LysM peptidoglycan-binding domain-containing protein [Ancylomarina longa]
MNCFFRSILFFCFLIGSVGIANSQNLSVELSKNKVVVGGETYFMHLVKEKQTLFSISKAYGVELSLIMRVNRKSDPNVKVGEVLRIPVLKSIALDDPSISEKNNDLFEYYIVKEGDTLYSISQKYGVDIKTIIQNNPGLNTNLVLGSVVRIPKSLQQKKEELHVVVPKPDKKYFYYVIKKGDTEYSISKQFFMKLRKFRKLNPSVKKKTLKIGSWVRIPRYLVPEEYFKIPEVKKDTISDLSNVMDTMMEVKPKPEYLAQNKIRIGLFLPLYLETNDTINQIRTYKDTIPVVLEREPRLIYSKSRNFIRFYQGVLAAIDSIEKEGISVDLHVFDTERSVERVQQIISRITYTDFDYFIGPVYQNTFSPVAKLAQQKGIPIISPLSSQNQELKTNPFVFQLNTSVESVCDKMSDYVCDDFDMKNIIVVHPERYKHLKEYKVVEDVERNLFESGKYWLNDQISYKKISFEEYGLYGIERILCDSCENVIILPINNQPLVENIITNLNVLSQRFAIRLVGFSKWQRFNSLDPELLYHLNFTMFSPYFVDYKSSWVNSFITNYRDKYLCEPNDFSYSGYDICTYFSKGISKFGKDFMEHINDMDRNMLLQSNYYFKRVNAFGGFENNGFHFLNYSRDFKIRHLITEPEKRNEEIDYIQKAFNY